MERRNLDHIAEHGVRPEEAEHVVRTARRPYPTRRGDGKWLVWGRAPGGRLLQVIFVEDDEGDSVYVIHARPLDDHEQRVLRRRTGR